ncbi:ABC transporter substrate-binding protein [Gryllotalpicola sp.]|uniref:ABC transporter substrate-binding protein n=1 Tax=Gryllotalpicola sp. TaxID=1932787 RepID=UPI002612913A|nr:ABC transporter substrate-binding protein [Gryllotalpicola sp.]
MSTLSSRGKAVAGAAGAVALALFLAACSSSPSSSSPSGSTGAAGAALPAASAPAAGEDSSTNFVLGTFLPLTGQLASLGPAAVAGAGEALSEINAAGGVNGKPARVISVDSGDATALQTIAEPNIKKLISSKVSAILGAESSGVTLDVLPTVDAAGIVMFSPANTSDALTGASKWYFRDPVPNSVEGNVLGAQIVADGHTKIAILTASEAYTTNLRDAIQKVLESNGASVTYGGTGKNQEFSQTETNFAPIVSAALATKPDAIVIDAEAQTTQILPALASAGFAFKNAYFIDGNLSSYDKTVGNLAGAQGTAQGINPTSDFQTLLNNWYKANENGATIDKGFVYAPESYDATIILALAADEAGSNNPADFVKYILPITGAQDAFTKNGVTPTVTPATGLTDVKTYADGLAAIKAGKQVHYIGVTGIGPLNSGHDPSSGYVTLYKFDSTNTPQPVTSVNSAK